MTKKMVFIFAILICICFLFAGTAYLYLKRLDHYNLKQAKPPYPPSPVLAGVDFDWTTHRFLAIGSDLWPTTWAADDHIYTSWGDGGGFGGTNSNGRVSLGFARIVGGPTNFSTKNVWGGKNPTNPALFGGKSGAMLSVEGTLYAWINMQNGSPPDQQLIWSDNLGASWQRASWTFPGDGRFFPNNFLNFGRDYENARDNYVYIYGNDRSDWSHLYLARVLSSEIKNRSAYEFFSGLDGDGNPTWTEDINLRQSVADDPDTIGASAAIFNPKINRYLLTTHHGNVVGRFGFFDAPEPWGPWTTVGYYNDWGRLGSVRSGMPHSFPVKWISSDGLTMYMIFSGRGIFDSFNLIKVMLKLKEPATLIPESKL